MPFYGKIVVTIDLQRQGRGADGGEFGSEFKTTFEFPESEAGDRSRQYSKAVQTVRNKMRASDLRDRWQQATINPDPDKMESALRILEG